MSIGENIRRLREQAGMTQADLGKVLGVTHSAVSLIENGKRGISLKQADKIAAALNTNLDELVKE
jgi:transcriptional regulator with XRE-family HTH domain